MERKNMFITIAIRNEVDISWLPGAKTDWENSRQKYMDLSGDTKPEEVDMLLRVMIQYNMSCDKLSADVPKDVLLRQLYHQMDKQKLCLPGGIHFIGDGKHIYPGRGSWMEEWLRTSGELMERNKIEMGFDPNVMFREKDGICYAISLDRYEYYAGSGMGSLDIEASFPDISVEEALSNEKITVISLPAG